MNFRAKRKIALVFVVCLVLALSVCRAVFGSPAVFFHNRQLSGAIRQLSSGDVTLNEVVPFEWDAVYTFPPYTSREQIEQAVGFASADIQENNINEGVVYLLFVKDKKVIANVVGYAENLGYEINFADKILFDDNAVFTVTADNGVVTLTPAG